MTLLSPRGRSHAAAAEIWRIPSCSPGQQDLCLPWEDDAKCFGLPQLAPAVPSPAVRDRVVLSSRSSARHVFSLEDLTSDGKLSCEL